MTGNERELVAKRGMTSPCAGCHANFDGYGLTRYRYDAIGRYNATKYVKMDMSVTPPKYIWDTNPAPLDESATIPALVGEDLKGDLAGPAALAAQLAADGVRRRVAYSAGAHLVMFLLGTDSNLSNSCELKDVKENFFKTGSFTNFFSGVALSPGFINRDPGM
jgi:hypothetical protein